MALVKLLDEKPDADHLPALLELAKDEWSRRGAYYGEEDGYPIAQAAVSALGKVGSLGADTAEQLYRIGIDTRDSDFRYATFALLARAAGSELQQRLIEFAVSPGLARVRRNAAAALLAGGKHAAPEITARITPELLATQIEPVASRLALLFAWRGELDAFVNAAESLATYDKRGVLLVLII